MIFLSPPGQAGWSQLGLRVAEDTVCLHWGSEKLFNKSHQVHCVFFGLGDSPENHSPGQTSGLAPALAQLHCSCLPWELQQQLLQQAGTCKAKKKEKESEDRKMILLAVPKPKRMFCLLTSLFLPNLIIGLFHCKRKKPQTPKSM